MHNDVSMIVWYEYIQSIVFSLKKPNSSFVCPTDICSVRVHHLAKSGYCIHIRSYKHPWQHSLIFCGSETNDFHLVASTGRRRYVQPAKYDWVLSGVCRNERGCNILTWDDANPRDYEKATIVFINPTAVFTNMLWNIPPSVRSHVVR
jgi:hypothetical protein